MAHLVDGEVSGISKTYYKNGRLEAEMHFKDGKLDGLSKEYYEDGGCRGRYTSRTARRTAPPRCTMRADS